MTRRSFAVDRRDGENWFEYWQRKHDEKHGPTCQCLWNRASCSALLPLDTVPEGKRIERAK